MNNAEVLITFKGDSSSVENATKEVQNSFKDMQKTGELALAGIGIALDKLSINFINGGIEYNAQIETYLTRLTTLTGSAEKANDVLEQIKKDALKTPFDVSSLTQAESLLLSTGLSAEEARGDILALGDAVSASGGGNAELQRMAINLQQIKNYGKASALDIRQFTAAGIPIYQMLADATGKTTEELKDMDITYDMLSEALQKANGEGGRFYKAMDKQSETYAGAMSNLKESLEVLKGEVAKDLFNAIKKIIPVLTKMFDWLGKNHKIVKAIAIPLLVFFNTIMAFKAITGVITIIKALGVAIAGMPIVAIIAGILALIAVIVYLWNNCEGFRNFIIGAFNIIKAGFLAVYNHIKSRIMLIIGIIKMLIEAFKKIIKAVADVKSAIDKKFQEIGKFIGDIVEEIKKKFDWFDDFVNIGKNLIDGIKKGVKDAWNGAKGWFKDRANDVKGAFKSVFGIHSPSKVFADEIGKNLVLGIEVGYGKELPNLQKMINSSFNLSPTLTGTANTHLSPNINVVVNNNMKTDPLGQVVNRVKTFSGGAKNDYNYGYGG